MGRALNERYQEGLILYNNPVKETKEKIINYLMTLLDSGLFQEIGKDKDWEKLIFGLLEKSEFRVKELIDYRGDKSGGSYLFNIKSLNSRERITFKEVRERVKSIAIYLANYRVKQNYENDFKIAILSENCLEMALVDLGALYSGVVNVIIPPNITEEHINFILNQSKPKLLFISSKELYAKIKDSQYVNNENIRVIALSNGIPESKIPLLNDEIKEDYPKENSIESINPLNIFDLATIMYTSGTTGEPKGIMFSNMNIISKRFARALALPLIGRNDLFLSYLPLFHTFGRYFEMMGAIFWGAEYIFADNSSIDTLIKLMQTEKPSIFISIPKKWVQLYDYICDRVDVETANKNEIQIKIKEITGGNLKWGLSAAGYLSSDVFKFFQNYDINLLSGFGMTEATGGITMTPPNKYKNDSIGIPLPGIETKLGNEGELLIRGQYVTAGYYGVLTQPFIGDNWFPTGDIMKIDEEGFHYIIDRKKDIYKNSRGETVAPQKIENLFLESEYIKQVFLVGDHRPYNTLLIYANEDSQLANYDENQKHDLFSSLIVSVNKFLPKHERIIDYRLIERPFSIEKEEITPKNTLKRWVIERNFINIISEMYVKNYRTLIFGDIEVNIPNWFLKEKGLLQQDIIKLENSIIVPKLGKELLIELHPHFSDVVKAGDFYYKTTYNRINLEDIITNPLLWIGNQSIYEFCGEQLAEWVRADRQKGNAYFYETDKVEVSVNYENGKTILLDRSKSSLIQLHTAITFLYARDGLFNLLGIKFLKQFIETDNIYYFKIVKELLGRIKEISNQTTLRELFGLVIIYVKEKEFKELLNKYLDKLFNLFDQGLINTFIEHGSENEIGIIEEVLDNLIKTFAVDGNIKKSAIPHLFTLLCNYGVSHPTKYVHIRQVFSKYETLFVNKDFSLIAAQNRKQMRIGFRKWLGENPKLAVDPDTGKEYKWSDVIVFDESVNLEYREKISNALKELNIVREAVFLFSNGVQISLNNIVTSGIFISVYRTESNRAIFKLSIQTRFQGAYSLLITVYNPNIRELVLEEINWMILAGSRYFLSELVEDFGGIWEEHDMWTTKYIPSDTVKRQLGKSFKKINYQAATDKELLLWYFYIWNCSATFFNFIRLTNYKYKIANPDLESFYVPEHDYHLGTRLVSFANREKFISIKDSMESFENQFIHPTFEIFPTLKTEKYYNFIFSGILNAFGEELGIKMLGEYLKSEVKQLPINDTRIRLLKSFINEVERVGFMPKQVYFAINRFLRWYANNKGASNIALAYTINDIYETYQLNNFENDYPELRIRFYLQTVFEDSKAELKKEIINLINKIRIKQESIENILDLLIHIKMHVELSEKEEYFLTRLTYPFVKPEASAVLVKSSSEAGTETNLVVQYEDTEGNNLYIRKPINPREINRLYQLFIDANLQVTFKPYHHFLIVTSEQGFIIGGLFYFVEDAETIRMEKIVINRKFRGKGISDLLMKDLFSRKISQNYKYLTTGYFRPEYFYKFGFKLDSKFGGLVKELIA